MEIHSKNIPHLNEEVELPIFVTKGRIVGRSDYFSSDTQKTSQELILVRLDSGGWIQNIFIEVIPVAKSTIKITNCTCGYSTEGFRK